MKKVGKKTGGSSEGYPEDERGSKSSEYLEKPEDSYNNSSLRGGVYDDCQSRQNCGMAIYYTYSMDRHATLRFARDDQGLMTND